MSRQTPRLAATAACLAFASGAAAQSRLLETRGAYPQALVERPLTLPGRMVEVDAGLVAASDRFGTLAVGAGLTDRLEFDLAGALCMDGGCTGLRQSVGAALAYAFVAEGATNLSGAVIVHFLHTLTGSSFGPGVSLAFAQGFGSVFQLFIEGGLSQASGERGVVAPYSDSAFGIQGRVEPRFQVTRGVALAPFIAFTDWFGSSATAYAVPVGLRAVLSPTNRVDLILQFEASDITASSTLVHDNTDFSGFFAVRF